MTGKLIAAGRTRLQKAADSTVDPAVPADLQRRTAGERTSLPAVLGGALPDGPAAVFSGGGVLSPEDITGSPQEQLRFVTESLEAISDLGARVEDMVVLNKGVLLEVAQERELHRVAGSANFAQWAAEVLDVEEKYVFELLHDSRRLRAIAALGPELARHLTRASTRKLVAGIIESGGLELARLVVSEGVAEATRQGKKRPTESVLAQVARTLTTPSIPAQESRSEISDLREGGAEPTTAASPPPQVLQNLRRAAATVRDRVYAPLAPAAVKAAAEADPLAARSHLAELGAEISRLAKRLAAAERTVIDELKRMPVDADLLGEDENT